MKINNKRFVNKSQMTIFRMNKEKKFFLINKEFCRHNLNIFKQ